MMTKVRDLRKALEVLLSLGDDTEVEIGIGGAELLGADLDCLAASARRELAVGDALYAMRFLGVDLITDTKCGLCARVILDTECANYGNDRLWREYVSREALRLGILERDNNNQNNDNNENEEGRTDEQPDNGRGSSFDPDTDAIGY